MSSSRESDDEVSVSDELSDEFSFKSVYLIYSIIELEKSNVEVMLRFSLTSRTNQMWVFGWIAENLHMLSQPGYAWLLLSLENVLSADDERAEYIAKCMANNFAGVGMEKPVTTQVLERVIASTINSGYLSPAFQSSVCTNAATLFGNHLSLKLMLKHGFQVADLSSKIKERYCLALARKDEIKSGNFLATLREITEFKLKKILQEIKEKIKSFKFVLHNNGGLMVDEIGRKVPTHAAKVFNIVSDALRTEASLIDNYRELAKKITDQLNVSDNSKAQTATGWFSMSWLSLPTSGVRDSSTTACYNRIINMLEEGISALNEYQGLQLRNPAMSQ